MNLKTSFLSHYLILNTLFYHCFYKLNKLSHYNILHSLLAEYNQTLDISYPHRRTVNKFHQNHERNRSCNRTYGTSLLWMAGLQRLRSNARLFGSYRHLFWILRQEARKQSRLPIRGKSTDNPSSSCLSCSKVRSDICLKDESVIGQQIFLP